MSLRLDQLLNSCTVKIKAIGESNHGTGFFVAPYIILTCAHVVRKQEIGQFVEVIPHGYTQPFLAKIKEFFPHQIDLALLQLEVNVSSSCVYLDTEIQPGDSCYAYGYTDPEEGFPEGEPVTLEFEGMIGGSNPLIKLKGGQVRPGLSGSPLLNLRTGKVCAVIKFTRNRKSDLGGGAIPIDAVFKYYSQIIIFNSDFHQQDKRWSLLLDPDTEALDSDWSYLDQASQRSKNYFKALWFLIKVIYKWFILGFKAPRAFPFRTITLLIEHTLKGDLGQEIKKQRRELTQRLNLEVNPEGTGQAQILNELDCQAWVLSNLINMLVGEEQDLASTSRLIWATEILYEQRSLIKELKKNQGNSYPQMEELKKRFKIFDDANDHRYFEADRIIGQILARHTDTNFVLWYSIKVFLKSLIEQIPYNPNLTLFFIEKLLFFLAKKISHTSASAFIKTPIEIMFADIENEIRKNPKLKILRKLQILLKYIAGEKVEGGLFRAWSPTGVYHFSRKCKLYPERVQPEEMRQILCYETREEAEQKHKPCKNCQSAESILDDNTEFLGEEPE